MAKKAAKKSAPAKKNSSARRPVKKDPRRDVLAKELRTLIPKLDAEGLAFLVKQSRIHIYNMQVDELNKAAHAANAASARSKKITATAKKERTAGNAKKEAIRIVATSSGSGYYLYYRNSNVVFSRDEMVQMVKIVNGPGSALEITERLFYWFNKERRDVFALVPIQDKFDPKIKTIVSLIKKNFKLRQK